MKKTAFLFITIALACVVFSGCARENPDLSGENTSDGGIPVAVGEVTVATLHGYVTAYGTVETDPGTAGSPAADVRITAPVDGVIAAVNCSENQLVKTGGILFRFDTTIPDAAVDKARNDLATAEKAFERQKQMQAINATSDRQYLEAEQQYESARSALATAERERNLCDVRAPIAGTVGSIGVRAGETVNAADILTEILDYSHLTVTANVPAEEIEDVAAGQQAFVTTGMNQSLNSGRIEGSVRYVSGSIDQENGSVRVVVSLPSDSPMRPGQFVKINIAYTEHSDCLAVPSESVVVDTDGQASVAVVTDNTAAIHTVRTGLMENGLTEILDSDLTVGMNVVVTGAYGLSDQAAVQITNR